MVRFDKEAFWAELDKLSEDRVRENLLAGDYGISDQNKFRFAVEWLRRREVSRSDAREERRQKRETQQAIAVIVAAIAATIGMIVSIVTLFSQ